MSSTAHASPEGLNEVVRRIAVEVAARFASQVDAEARFPTEAFAELRRAGALSAYVPRELGGAGVNVASLAEMCTALGQRCASTGMIFAMHQIQVACLVRHGLSESFFREHLSQLTREQRLIASVTSEAGVGGSTRTSIAPIEYGANGQRRLKKNGTVVSYGEAADDLLITARRSAEAPASDQALILVRKNQCALDRTATWDTMGMRGTCSFGYIVTADFDGAQIVPAPFADVSAHTMVPFAHLLWGATWLGIATDAVARARAFVRDVARRMPGQTPPTTTRLAEVSTRLQLMRLQQESLVREFDALTAQADGGREELSSLGFALKMNNLKVSASQLVVEIVTAALRITGTTGYRNDSEFSVVRHLRDAHSAALMIGNDRILANSGPLHLMHRDD